MKYEQLTIKSNQPLAEGHWMVVLEAAKPLPEIQAGQFISLRCDPADTNSLLRPFSILDADYQANTISVYYKHLGRMSSRLSAFGPGVCLDCLFPLGNSFPRHKEWRSIALVGGGVGLAPMLYLAQRLMVVDDQLEVRCYFGGNTGLDLVPDLLQRYEVPIELATMDGSLGYQGTVVDLFANAVGDCDVVYTCGPNPMMAALVEKLPARASAYASLEEYMACSVGACYGCAVKILEDGGYSNQRVCLDGPVFDLRRVVFKT